MLTFQFYLFSVVPNPYFLYSPRVVNSPVSESGSD